MTRTIEQVIGEKVAQLRGRRGWNQRQLGEALEAATGRKWERQSVWSAEKGKRVWAASDLIGLAQVFDVTIGELMATTEDVLVGTVTTSADVLSRRTEGAGQMAAQWQKYLSLINLANILRQVENAWEQTAKDVSDDVQLNPKLREEIQDRHDRYYVTFEREAKLQADSDRNRPDVSTPAKLRAYMEGRYDQVPEIRAAMKVLGGAR